LIYYVELTLKLFQNIFRRNLSVPNATELRIVPFTEQAETQYRHTQTDFLSKSS